MRSSTESVSTGVSGLEHLGRRTEQSPPATRCRRPRHTIHLWSRQNRAANFLSSACSSCRRLYLVFWRFFLRRLTGFSGDSSSSWASPEE